MKISTTVITGFLGAGKTTLIRDLLTSVNGRRIALIINEFGDLPIDGEILKGCGLEDCKDDDIVELANGCICCTVGEDFVPTMTKILNREDRPDHIIIETSGLALPQPLVRAFRWPEIRNRAQLDGVIAVLDGLALSTGGVVSNTSAVDAQRTADPMLDHETALEDLLAHQIEAADLLVLTKTDMLDEAGLKAARERAGSGHGAGKTVLESGRHVLTADALLGLGLDPDRIMNGHEDDHHDDDHHEDDHEHVDFLSHVIDLPAVADPDTLARAVKAAMESCDVYRVKGIAAVEDKDMRLIIQGVGSRVQSHYDRDWRDDESRTTRLVFIGNAVGGADGLRSALHRAIDG
ncbi:cobalamin biosynthesis protein CobW [Fodinicurvata sp. EGI_FJ10296]|uniref:cobalamin biosynthesis protein CobW n=1 Tax=Fodinicurvata sp. EGI_FJ10296 TaxID=3231908 RepID=UPI0034543FB0